MPRGVKSRPEIPYFLVQRLSCLANATLRTHMSDVDISADRSRGLAIPAFADFYPQNLDTAVRLLSRLT